MLATEQAATAETPSRVVTQALARATEEMQQQ
jgi:hypothetical protein